MRLSVLRVLSLLSVVAGCTLDYGVSGEKNQPGADTGTSSSDTDGDPRRDECPDPDTTPIDVQIDESCEAPPEVGAWTPVVEWTSSAVGDSYASPVVGQLTDDNGDGVIDDQDMPDIVVAGTGGLISVISGDGSRVHWQGGNLGSEPSTPAIADLDNDGRPEVIATGSTGAYAFRGDSGQVYWSNAQVGSTQFICGGVAVADLEGDGRPEIIQGGYVLEGRTGNLRFRVAGMGTGYTGSTFASFGVAADIDQDGDQEVVTGNAIYDASGNELWSTRQNDGFVAVANFDRDPAGEMVVSWYPGMVRLQDDDGTVLWSGSYTGNTVGPPTIADFDGDGEPEIGVAGNGVYVVIETDGTRKWTRNVVDYSSGFTGSSVFDFEGDGKAEVVTPTRTISGCSTARTARSSCRRPSTPAPPAPRTPPSPTSTTTVRPRSSTPAATTPRTSPASPSSAIRRRPGAPPRPSGTSMPGRSPTSAILPAASRASPRPTGCSTTTSAPVTSPLPPAASCPTPRPSSDRKSVV